MSNKQIMPAELALPNNLRIITINSKPIFPGIITPLMLSSADDLGVVEAALASDSMLGLILTRDPANEEPGADQIFRTGTAARIIKKINLPDGGVNVIITTLRRFVIKKILQKEHPIIVAADYPTESVKETLEVKALARSLLSEMKELSENNPLFSEDMRLNMVNIDHPGKIADFITGILNIERRDQQRILETLDVKERMEAVLMHIKKEQELHKIQKKIQGQINEKIESSQREYFLREQLKLIKTELGIATDAKSSEYNRFQTMLDGLKLVGEAKEQVTKEMEKFSLMDPNGSEYQVTRNYLDTVLGLPWTVNPSKPIDIAKARKILDADHYGLDDVKQRIIEFLAVGQRRGDFKGSILCLLGPPGVGKTSIGKSIARALKKEFFRFSVGGMRDEAEIKGHRRTYVGAMPGKIIQGLKVTKTLDPVFMIDEIDKLGASYQGDPSSALLEVLDPEQNSRFRDHYLDLPFDISKVLFIATANSLDTIPGPLLDRMELIRLSGYIPQEKVSIAKKYIVPKSLAKHGLKKSEVSFSKEALLAVAEQYARESGVRNFEKAIDKINRKIATKAVLEQIKLPVEIGVTNLAAYLGKPLFRDDEDKVKSRQPGIVTGLAWTSVGGDTLSLEAIKLPGGKDGLKLTGQMGNVMQESASIAYSFVRSIAQTYGIAADFWNHNAIHLHIPAGATPKDGPSAGITMATCLLSLATNRPIRPYLAMTGELSLTGQVLPIGGLKEKSIAAIRAGIREVIIPQANERDLDEMPAVVKKQLRFHSVTQVEEVFRLAFD
jgi:ATP-dependent Lon protease